jgi:hypothetical protein
MPTEPESIAATPATSWVVIKVVKPVDKARFDSEKAYQLTMSMARTMLRRGLISREEYTRIDVMMTQKYRPLLGLLPLSYLDLLAARSD